MLIKLSGAADGKAVLLNTDSIAVVEEKENCTCIYMASATRALVKVNESLDEIGKIIRQTQIGG